MSRDPLPLIGEGELGGLGGGGGLGGVIIIHWPPQSGMVKIDAPLISQILGSILEVWGEPIIPCAVSVGILSL